MKKFFSIISILLCISLLCSCSIIKEDKSEMKLSNANATESTKKVYAYICDTYGNGIISGQQESTWVDGSEYEMNYIYDITGKYPAMRGLDFMNDDFDGVIERAVDWWNKGGLVATKWTWNSIIKAVLEVMCIALIVKITERELLLLLAIVLALKVL